MPVGGVDLVPTFVALLGHHLDVTVLIDARKSGHQKLSRLTEQGILEAKRIITVGQIIGAKAADIEDLFEPQEYVDLYNLACAKNWKVDDLDGNGTIVSQIARKEGVDRYDHGKPADALLRHRDKILPGLSEDTLKRFEALFAKLNETLPA